MNKQVIIFIFYILLGISLLAEQLTTIAVVDINEVYSKLFSSSSAVRSLERLRDNIQKELDNHIRELRSLQEQKLKVEESGFQTEALRLDNAIFEKTQYIQEFQRVKQAQLQARQSALSASDSFLSQFQSAIRYVAEVNGFTIVVSANDDKLLWWSEEVDITELVLERLQENSSSP